MSKIFHLIYFRHYICQISEHFESQTYSRDIRFAPWEQTIFNELAPQDVSMSIKLKMSIIFLPRKFLSILIEVLSLILIVLLLNTKLNLLLADVSNNMALRSRKLLPLFPRLLLLVVSKHWHLVQLDVNNVFLNGKLWRNLYEDSSCYKYIVQTIILLFFANLIIYRWPIKNSIYQIQ